MTSSTGIDAHIAEQMLRRMHAWDHSIFAWSCSRPPSRYDGMWLALTHACDNGGLWWVVSGGIAVLGGRRGRRAVASGLIALAITSPVVNGPFKWLARRNRPNASMVPLDRRLRSHPGTTSFPSGHSASAWSYSVAATMYWPLLGIGLIPLAAAIAWSRVVTGAHYPGDAAAGALIGMFAGVGVGLWSTGENSPLSSVFDRSNKLLD